MTKIQELTTKIEEAKSAVKACAKDAFKELFAEFFKENPDITAFRWRQFTPYFNDGDPCRFRGPGGYSDEFSIFVGDDWTEFYDYEEEHVPTLDKIASTISGIDDGIFLAAFGDNAEVQVYKDGRIEVEEYVDHD